MQFFQVAMKGRCQDIDIVNIFWYRRNTVGLPTTADLDALLNTWELARVPKFTDVLQTVWELESLTAYGYRDTWVRTPYLPVQRNYTAVTGVQPGPAAPPILCAILSARVEPVVPDPTTNKAVRKGYWAISCLAETQFNDDGNVNPSTLVTAPFVALATDVATPFPVVGAIENMEPIKVSRPGPATDARGYGLIESALWSPYASARRSRKRGHGAH